MDDFMRDFNNNNNSLFELNKNIYRPRYITPKYNRVRHSPKVRQKYGVKHKEKKIPQKKIVQARKKSVQARKKFVEARKKTIKNKIDKLKKEMKKL